MYGHIKFSPCNVGEILYGRNFVWAPGTLNFPNVRNIGEKI